MSDFIKDQTLESLSIGERAHFEHTVTDSDVEMFADVSGDYNPLHMDEAYAKGTVFGKRVVHGMFIGALISRFVGMYIPGRRALLMKEVIEFKKPLYIGNTVTVSGIVTGKSTSTGIIEIDIRITAGDVEVASSIVHARVLA